MVKFRRGDTLDIKLVISHKKVGIKDVHIFFVHEEDDNAHIFWGLQGSTATDNLIHPNEQTTLRWDKTIPEDQKLGVYTLDTMNFKTFDDTTLEVAGSVRIGKFEVVPAGEDVSDIEDVPDPGDTPPVVSDSIVVEEFSLST